VKIVVVGASGTIGTAVVRLLKQKHQVIAVSRSSGDYRADITNKASVEATLVKIGKVDAIVSTVGSAVFKPLFELTDADFENSLRDKLMGQVNILRVGSRHVMSGGSITLTSGVLAGEPVPGSAAISLVNAGLEGFGRAASLELRGVKVRVNVVSPPWVRKTLVALSMDPSAGMPADEVAKAYEQSVKGSATGYIIDARETTT
jgi:NAD(P)-dependent dehydrogenase (short-subunit alcohol dehydrogenase family)